jgi:hypothetical protein
MRDREKEHDKSKRNLSTDRESAQIFVMQLQELGFGGDIFKAWNGLVD